MKIIDTIMYALTFAQAAFAVGFIIYLWRHECQTRKHVIKDDRFWEEK